MVQAATETPTRGETGGRAPPATAPGADPSPKPFPFGDLLGQAVCLLARSPAHKHLFLADLDWRLLPPVALKQFRLFRDKDQPVAFASWAFLSEDAEKRFLTSGGRLAPADWRPRNDKTGERLWLVDLVAPPAGRDAILKTLREEVLKGRAFSFRAFDGKEGKAKVVRMGDGANA